MGFVIIFVVGAIFFTLTFNWIIAIVRFTWIVIMHGNEYVILACVFIGMGGWLVYAL